MLVAADLREGTAVYRAGMREAVFAPPGLCAAALGRSLACFSFREAALFSPGPPVFFTPPPCVTRAFFARGALAALSEEGAGVYLLSAETGAPLLFAPLAACPRDMALSPCGRFAAVCARDEARVLELSPLCPRARFSTGGEAAALCFQGGALYALSGRGEGCALVKCGAGALRRFPGAPLSLCAFGRGLLVGTKGRLYHTDLAGRTLRVWPSALPTRAVPAFGGAYVCDPFEGRVTHYPAVGRARIAARLPAPTDVLWRGCGEDVLKR